MSSDNSPEVPPNDVESSDGLDALPNAPAPATVDPHSGLTIPNDAVQCILTRSPTDPPLHVSRPPPGRKILPVESDIESEDELKRRPSSSPPPKSASPEADLQCPASTSNNRNKPPTPKAKPVKKAKPAAPKKPLVTKPSPSQVPKTISKPKGTTKRNHNGPKFPVRGIDFPDTGFVPTGTKAKKGPREGHLTNKDCRGSPPNGCSMEEWKDKFRSVESTLMRQLEKVKDRLDDMRDSGWIRDRALYMWDKEQQRKAAKAAKEAAKTRLAGEKNKVMEDVEEQDEEMKDVEEEGEEDVEEQDEEMKEIEEEGEEEEENQVYVPPQIEEDMDDIYDA
ncbi:uncharacterized protein K444DRAFT_633556 [Hyaloscypha bicolor E]|uniref:Uncharacterized protein n=1 Tax=Hyaloscypha bicolor E TaxID=1095630 RepID=A0A2J6SX99_9HELO|nr:uncharacterized protein K444DRAFT_633556 [Hyaloscypha bicolor E]PMD55407.1 hypothetical protein K444DRAFT_633556 [Hyaloscypha bicolor E]